MANRTGTMQPSMGLAQAALLGLTSDTTEQFRRGARTPNIEFNITNSHDKTYAVRDSVKGYPFINRFRSDCERQKICLSFLQTQRHTGNVLSYEIEQAIDNYKMPLIIAYPNFSSILNVNSHRDVWPKSLADRINKDGIEAIHIPFQRETILEAISRFYVNGEHLSNWKEHTAIEKHTFSGD